ncbi:hypothetical protein NM688_g1532 [Phlebia brevispora]|uniref:Uncharacterized protein n=1 Tax=Phlebia brevispora TaxID=194682 RepID=A0ACC1TB24_9APHY|nr:hypothetical protein NM688_g1532 [Phlebia brevispora]
MFGKWCQDGPLGVSCEVLSGLQETKVSILSTPAKYEANRSGLRFWRKSAIVKKYPTLSNLSTLEFDLLFPTIPCGPNAEQYYMPEVEEYAKKPPEERLPVDDEDLESCRELVEKDWRRRPEMEPILEHAALCQEWYEKMKNERSQELKDIRERRYNDIEARLKALGWGPELDYLEENDVRALVNHPRVSDPKELTEKAWEKLLPSMVEILEQTRANRLQRDRLMLRAMRLCLFAELYAEWRNDQDSEAVLPQAVDLSIHSELQDLVFAPGDIEVHKATFEPLRELLPTWVEQWRIKCRSTLAKTYVTDGESGDRAADAQFLNLATAVWTCRLCSHHPDRQLVLHYPEVMEHRCLYKPLSEGLIRQYVDEDEWKCLVSLVSQHSSWSSVQLTAEKARPWASEVIRACGMDPASVTTEEMDKLDVRLICKECWRANRSSSVETKKVFSWRAAVSIQCMSGSGLIGVRDQLRHYMEHDKYHGYIVHLFIDGEIEDSTTRIEWERVSDDQLRDVKATEASAKEECYDPAKLGEYPEALSQEMNSLCCAYCPQGRMDLEDAVEHVAEHSFHFENPTGPDFYRDKSLGSVISSPVMLIVKPKDFDELHKLWNRGDPVADEASTTIAIIHSIIMARGKTNSDREARPRVLRRRRGALQSLPTMPLDILAEIMSHLQPPDILNMSRANKTFRRFLMTRSSEFIWRRARENVPGLPPCPEDLSEPAYANLVFDTHCHECLSSGVKTVFWEFRVRYCPSCRKQKFMCQSAVVQKHPILSKLDGLEFDLFFPSIPYGSEGSKYHVPDVETYIRNTPQEELSPRVESASSLLTKDRRQRPELQRKLEHAALCKDWYTKRKDERSQELKAIRDRRYQDITGRLKALGWGQELEFLDQCEIYNLKSLLVVTEPKELTQKRWEKILPSLLDMMDSARLARMRRDRLTLLVTRFLYFTEFYAQWRKAQGHDAILPLVVDLVHHDELRELILTPQDTTVTQETFETLRELLSRWAEEWRANCRSHLVATYRTDHASHVGQTDAGFLALASSVWTCENCSHILDRRLILHYPEVMEHRCLYRQMDEESIPPCGPSPHEQYEFICTQLTQHSSWACEPLNAEKAYRWALEVIRACGMDPASTTTEEMDKLDVRLMCKTCWKANDLNIIDAKKVFTWRAALRHYMEHNEYGGLIVDSWKIGFKGKISTSIEWELVAEDQLPRIKKIEDSTKETCYNLDKIDKYPLTLVGEMDTLCCAYCPESLMDMGDALEHAEQHLDSAVKYAGPDFFRDKSLGPVIPSPVMLVTKPRSINDLMHIFANDHVAGEAFTWIHYGRAENIVTLTVFSLEVPTRQPQLIAQFERQTEATFCRQLLSLMWQRVRDGTDLSTVDKANGTEIASEVVRGNSVSFQLHGLIPDPLYHIAFSGFQPAEMLSVTGAQSDMAKKETSLAVGGFVQGCLKNLLVMPVDILVEVSWFVVRDVATLTDIYSKVMSHLHPMDILNLSRTSKNFRKFLMTRTAQFIWRRARENIEDFPPCPKDLSGPAYADLAFDNYCHGCSAIIEKEPTVWWELRARYCASCTQREFLSLERLMGRYPLLYQLSDKMLHKVFPSVDVGYGQWRKYLYCMPEVKKIVSRVLQQHHLDSSVQCDHWRDRPEMKHRVEHANLWREWRKKVEARYIEELEALTTRRYNYCRVCGRLEALDWGPELAFLERNGRREVIRYHPGVRETLELTEKAWEAIYFGLCPWLQSVRAELAMDQYVPLHGERIRLFNMSYAEWRRVQGPDVTLPQAIDIMDHTELQGLITASADTLITQASFDTLIELLPIWVHEWRLKCQSLLLETTTTNPSPRSSVDAFFALASTVWICNRCSMTRKLILHYPEVLDHQCLHQAMDKPSLARYSKEPLEVTLRMANCMTEKWSCQEVLLGREEWARAIAHYIDHIAGSELPVWQRIDENHLSRIKEIEELSSLYYHPGSADRYPERAEAVSATMRCAYCPRGHMSEENILNHLDYEHQMSIPKEQRFGYYREKNFRLVLCSPIILVMEPRTFVELQTLAQDNLLAQEAAGWTRLGCAGFLEG